MAVQLLTVSAYARHRGCDEKAVRRAIEEARITAFVDADGKRRIDPEVADIQWAKNTRARADSGRARVVAGTGAGVSSGAGLVPDVAPAVALTAGGDGPATGVVVPGVEVAAPDGQPNYSDFRARTEKATAERAERENMREAGKLADTDQVKRGIYDSYRALRDAAMAVAQRAAPKCIGLGDARDIERVISDELRKAFEGWEQRMLDMLPKEDGT